MSSDMDRLQGLLNTVAYPESPEERDAAEDAIKDMVQQARAQALEDAADAMWDVSSATIQGPDTGQSWLRARARSLREQQ